MSRPPSRRWRQWMLAKRRGCVGALHVDANNGVPLFFGHVENHAVAEDAGDVHEDVELTPFVEGRAHQVLRLFDIGDVGEVGDRLAPALLDLLGDERGGGIVFAFTINRDTKVVDDDAGALSREELGDFGANTAAGAGDDGSFSVEFSHDSPSITYGLDSTRRVNRGQRKRAAHGDCPFRCC